MKFVLLITDMKGGMTHSNLSGVVIVITNELPKHYRLQPAFSPRDSKTESEPVQEDVKNYLESQKIRAEYDSQIGELETKKDKEETRFNEYDRKYRDNFVRVRTAKSDF